METNQKVVQYSKTQKILCSNNYCKKELVVVHQSENNKELSYMLSVKCPFCNRYSYDFPVFGNILWHPSKNIKITGIKEDEINNRVVWETIKNE